MMDHLDYNLEIEAKAIGESGTFEGYASTFGNVDLGGDVVEPGAFIESVVKAKKDRRVIPMLWQHDRHEPIGVWTSIAEDAKGLFVKGKLLIDEDPLAKRAYAHLKAGSIGGMSIGYRTIPGETVVDEKRPSVMRLKKVDLREMSLVTMPMNTQARVTSVKQEQTKKLRDRLAAGDRLTKRELDFMFKEAWRLSNSEAERAVRLHFKHGQGDPDGAVNEGKAFLASLLSE